MPSPQVIKQTILMDAPMQNVGATNQTQIPSFSGTSTAGVITAAGANPAGHLTRTFDGAYYVNLPTGGNAFCPSGPGNRVEFFEPFLKLPALNAVLDTTGASSSAALIAYTVANKDWEVLGSNMTTALCTAKDGGGILLTTAGGANTTDAAILTPHLDTAQTAWAWTKWNTNDCVFFQALIAPVAVTTTKVWVGLKKTNTPVLTTDTDQAYLVFDTADEASTSTTNWVAVTSRTNADTKVDTGIKAVAGGHVLVTIFIDPNKIPYFFINGALVAVGNGTRTTGVTTSAGALTADVDLIPYIGCIQRTNSTAAAVIVRHVRMSKLLND